MDVCVATELLIALLVVALADGVSGGSRGSGGGDDDAVSPLS